MCIDIVPDVSRASCRTHAAFPLPNVPGGALRVPAPPPGRDPQRGRQAAAELRPGADGPEGATAHGWGDEEMAEMLQMKHSMDYPLVNYYIAMERSTMFNGKNHYKWLQTLSEKVLNPPNDSKLFPKHFLRRYLDP